MRDNDFRTFEGAVAAQVLPPSFDALVRNANQRRRNAYAAAGTVAASAVVASVAVANLGGPTRDEPAPPVSSTPAPAPGTGDTTTSDELTPEQIVQSPGALLDDFAVSPTDPDVRAAVWRVCLNSRCGTSRRALAVTNDGFRTMSFVPLPARRFTVVTALRSGGFIIDAGRQFQRIVDAAGGMRDVTMDDGAPSPLRQAETLLPELTRGRSAFAVGPTASLVHAVPVPPDSNVTQQADGQLVAVTQANPNGSVAVSDDGGATWHPSSLDTGRGALLWPAESAGQTLGIAERADGATLFPFVATWRSADAGRSWERAIPSIEGAAGDTAYISGTVVLPDGRLLVCVEAWSDERRGRPSTHPYGLYVSNGTDWSSFSPVSQPTPTDVETGAFVSIVGSEFSGGTARVYLKVGSDRIYATVDAGASWEQVSVR
jgi:hypothetical protein